MIKQENIAQVIAGLEDALKEIEAMSNLDDDNALIIGDLHTATRLVITNLQEADDPLLEVFAHLIFARKYYQRAQEGKDPQGMRSEYYSAQVQLYEGTYELLHMMDDEDEENEEEVPALAALLDDADILAMETFAMSDMSKEMQFQALSLYFSHRATRSSPEEAVEKADKTLKRMQTKRGYKGGLK